MKLPFLNENTSKGEVYCGILLKEGQGICFVYEKRPTSVLLLKQKEFQYSDGWEHIVDDIDDTLSLIEQDLGKQTIISQCVFFVFAHLVDQNTHEINKSYIAKLRDISKLLELKPVGYMEVIDAIHEELEKEKQTRLSSIIVELDDTQMTIFLYKGGHKIAVQHGERTDNFAEDIQNNLEKIAQSHMLPNHIYLYDSTDLAEESSDLLLYSWKKDLFIQQPRIAVIQPSTVSKALLNLLEKQLCEQPQIMEPKDGEKQPNEVMGFTIGGEAVEENNFNENEGEPKKAMHFSLPKIALPSLPSFFVGRIVPFALIPVVLVGISIGLLFVFHKAVITITVPTEKRSAEMSILASKKPTNPNQVELQSVTSAFSSNEKKDTTGKRDIGEKAAGEITLYSYDEKERQLTKGTKVQFNSLNYEIDDAVSIPPSQFASDSITKNPGKAKVKLRASVLGTESNIDKNKRFSVADVSSNIVFGINEAALTGGTKKTVRTISKNDIDSLKSFVLDKVKQEAITKQKSETGYLLLPALATAQATKEQFSGEVGEEADALRYIVSGEVVLSRIPKKTIDDFVGKKLEGEKPSGYKTEKVDFVVKKQSKTEDGDMQLTIGGDVSFSKSLSEKEIITSVRGKTREDANFIIQNQYGITKMELAVTPPIPLIQDRIPFWSDHIRIELLK